jgi:hypothetical protein
MRPLILAMILVILLMLVPVEGVRLLQMAPALRSELQNAVHPAIFAALAVLGRRTVLQAVGTAQTIHILLLAATLIVFAGLTEVLQGLTGREQSFGDFIGDLLGTISGMLWPLRKRPATWLANLTALLACTPLFWTTSAYLYRSAKFPLVWQIDSRLLNRFSHWQAGEYPGLVLEELPADWRGYQTLAITVRNPGPAPESLTVRIHDLAHDQRYDDRFNRTFLLAAASTEIIRIPLSEIAAAPAGRPLDLASVAGLVMFQHSDGFRVIPTEIRLH